MGSLADQAVLDADGFRRIAALAHRESGIRLNPEKQLMVQSRLRHRLRALKVPDFAAYTDLVCSDDGMGERRFMISALTTNVSNFFREAHHLDLVAKHLLPTFRARMAKGERMRIWSAGCSNGQEPYTIAMFLLRHEPRLADADFRILATDIDPKVIAFARKGKYSHAQLSGVSAEDRATFTTEAGVDDDGRIMARKLRDLVSFQELNLFAEWPMKYPFDLIFCRNVVIYFDLETQERLWPRFHGALAQGGLFMLGHSERIAEPSRYGFTSIGPTAYRKTTTAPRSVHA